MAKDSGWTVPALQLVQLLDEMAPRIVEYLPMPHVSHWVSAIRPVPVWYFPPTHWIQLADESDAWLGLYVPAAQKSHTLSPDPLW
jgi:dipeptidyl aminopeptidase/acylaminoacyl peptidase